MTGRPKILLVEDDERLADQLNWGLKETFTVKHAGTRPAAVEALKRWRPDLVLLDLCIPPGGTSEEGFRVLQEAAGGDRLRPVVVMSALEEREAALRAVEEGAYDFFPKPVDLPALRVVIRRALERQALLRENLQLKEEIRSRFSVDGIVGSSEPMQQLFEAIHRVKDAPLTVTIQGESGTGKELVARAIHTSGDRAAKPFVAVHCAAFPESLLEAEIFGHEKGAFTGASGTRIGRFEAADGGTLFLDEVSCLTPSIQTKLLRVLEERKVERLGSNQPRGVDIRLIVASNEDLEEKVARGEFREDLFFRINVFPIRIPPLRERPGDIPILADHFVERICRERGIPPKRFTAEARRDLVGRDWPGNVRQLLNAVETMVLMADGEEIGPGDLPGGRGAGIAAASMDESLALGFKAAVMDFEKKLLTEAIARAGGVKSRAARELGLAPGQMKHFVRKHGL